MKRTVFVLLTLGFSLLLSFSFASTSNLSGQAYMDRFNTYSIWSQNLSSVTTSPEFLKFIQETSPLS